MLMKEIFGEYRVVGLAGSKSCGKTNNLMFLLKDFRKLNKTTPIYVYGLTEKTVTWLRQFGSVFEISSLEQLANKRNSLIVIDEMQQLKLCDKRYTDQLNEFVDFIYHNNNWVILSSPNLRDFNSVIGSKIERWLLKSMNVSSLVNGSQLKMAVLAYKGRFKSMNSIDIEPDKLLIMNVDYEKVVECEYIKEVDEKAANVNIFEMVKEPVRKRSEEKSE